MLTPAERTLFTDLQDRLIELYYEQKEAMLAADPGRVSELQIEIDEAKRQLTMMRGSALGSLRPSGRISL